MADQKPDHNPLDAWMSHIDQNQNAQPAKRGRDILQKAADKRPPQPPAQPGR